MKLLQFGLVITAAFAGSLAVHAQTADQVIAKHLEAIGGKDKIKQIKTLYVESTIDVMGQSAPGQTYIVNGKGYKQELDFGGSKIIQVITEKDGWMINPMMGSTEPQPLPEDQYKQMKDQIVVGGNFVNFPAAGSKTELLPKSGDSVKVKVTSAEQQEATYFFDPKTYYLTKTIVKGTNAGQPYEITTTFTDYKKTDYGYVMPYLTNIDTGMMQLSFTVSKVEVNKEIDPKIFNKP